MKSWSQYFAEEAVQNGTLEDRIPGLIYTKMFQKRDPKPRELFSEEKSERLLRAWHDFHGNNTYDNCDMFYSKRVFCASMHMSELNETAFMNFIADRCFLFL